MKIWLIMLVPVIFVAILIVFFRRKVVWWELAIPLGVSALLITIFKLTSQSIITNDIEYWGNYITRVQYYQPWDKWVDEMCSYDVASGTDSNGNTTYTTIYYDCSHSVNYGPEFFGILNSGDNVPISGGEYQRMKSLFGNNRLIDLHRDYYQTDGDLMESDYDGSYEKYEFVATKHHYKNKVQASTQHFFPKITPEEIALYNLYEYPPIKDYSLPAILGYEGYIHDPIIDKKFDWLNGKLGMSKELRVWILLYKNSLPEAGIRQESLWKGGNQNELIVTIGIDENSDVQWAQVITWSEVEGLKPIIQRHVEEMGKLDLSELADFLYKKLERDFVRKDFAEFKYLTIEPPGWAMLVTFLVTLITNILLSFWIVKNEYDADNPSGW